MVVACANSLARPSVLTSPTLALPTPIQAQEPVGGHQVWALTGRAVSQDRPQPITDKEYQQRLKQLEEELNKNGDKKKATGEDKFKDKSRPSELVALEIVNTTEASVDPLEEMQEEEPMTTLAPLRHPEVTEGMPAVVVEYDDLGDPVHRITLQEQVEVVTEATTPMEMEEEVTEEPATEPTTMMPELDVSLAREGKQVPGKITTTATMDEPCGVQHYRTTPAVPHSHKQQQQQ